MSIEKTKWQISKLKTPLSLVGSNHYEKVKTHYENTSNLLLHVR